MNQLRGWIRQLLASKAFWYAVLFGVFFGLEIALLVLNDLVADPRTGVYLILFFTAAAIIFISMAAAALRLLLGLRGREMWKQGARFVSASAAAAGVIMLLKMQTATPAKRAAEAAQARVAAVTEVTKQIETARLLSEGYELRKAEELFRQARSQWVQSRVDREARTDIDVELSSQWAKHSFRAGRYEPALELALSAAKIDPRRSDILFLAGQLRERYQAMKVPGKREKSSTAASRFYESAFHIDPQNYPALAAAARTLGRDDFPKAERRISELVRKRYFPRAYHWAMAEAYGASGRVKESLLEFDRALATAAPAHQLQFTGDILLSQGRIREAAGQAGRALQSYEAAALSNPCRDGFFEAGRLLFSMGRYFESERLLLRLLSLAPEYPGAHSLLGLVYRKIGQPDLAKRALAMALAENPDALSAAVELAGLRVRAGAYGEAVDVLSKFLSFSEDKGYLWVARAWEAEGGSPFQKVKQAVLIAADSYGRLGKPEEARRVLKEGLHFFGADDRTLAAALKKY